MVETMGDAGQAVARLRPDGDAVGSELALVELAHRLGAEAEICNHDPSPVSLRDLPGADRVQVVATLPEGFEQAFDLAVTLECSELERSGFEHLGLELRSG